MTDILSLRFFMTFYPVRRSVFPSLCLLLHTFPESILPEDIWIFSQAVIHCICRIAEPERIIFLPEPFLQSKSCLFPDSIPEFGSGFQQFIGCHPTVRIKYHIADPAGLRSPAVSGRQIHCFLILIHCENSCHRSAVLFETEVLQSPR